MLDLSTALASSADLPASRGVRSNPRSLPSLGLFVGLALGLLPCLDSSARAELLLPRTEGGGASEEVFVISLEGGGGLVYDRLDGDPTDIRRQPLGENLFDLIGRSREAVGRDDELFLQPLYEANGSVRSAVLVEGSTGYVAYFERVGRNGSLGEIKTLIGRPYEGIAAGDGRYALLMHRDRSGRTVGAYLYRTSAGDAVYMDQLDDLEIDPQTTRLSGLPTLDGPAVVVDVLDSEETRRFAVADSASGRLVFLDTDPDRPGRLLAREGIDLAEAFESAGAPAAALGGRRFHGVAVTNNDDDTDAIFWIDAATGSLGLLEGVRAGTPRLRLAPRGLAAAFGGEGPWRLSVLPDHASNGVTEGVWIFDRDSGSAVYASSLGLLSEFRLEPVRIER